MSFKVDPFERVDRLSGGERQRVGLARALLERQESWELVSFDAADQAPQGVTRWLAQAA